MEISLSRSKALKYLGYKDHDTTAFNDLIDRTIQEVTAISKVAYIVDYQDILSRLDSEVLLKNGIILQGKSISNRLRNCSKAAIFIATIGCDFDKKLLSLQHIEPMRAALFDSAGSAYIEEVAEKLYDKIKNDNKDKEITKRFSAGFGDLPLKTNKDLINMYNATRRLGIVISEIYLMSPAKTVTAIAGIRGEL